MLDVGCPVAVVLPGVRRLTGCLRPMCVLHLGLRVRALMHMRPVRGGVLRRRWLDGAVSLALAARS